MPGSRPSSKAAVVHPKDTAASSLTLHVYPSAVLRSRALPVEPDANLPVIAQRMLSIMHEEEGIGLAAPQVGLPWRLFVLDVPPPATNATAKPAAKKRDVATTVEGTLSHSDGPLAFVNPVITMSGTVEPFEEGCLSLPEIRCKVLRPPVVSVQALDVNGKPFTLIASGLLARCIQHEFDHIEGVLIVDRMSPMDRLKNRRAIKELEG